VEGRYFRQVRDELTRHVGGRPSPAQKILIERCAQLMLRIRLMDVAHAKDDFLSEKNTREYLVWTNSLSRLLKQLGLEEASANEKQPSLDNMWDFGTSAAQ
jgi:hypothetical protein